MTVTCSQTAKAASVLIAVTALLTSSTASASARTVLIGTAGAPQVRERPAAATAGGAPAVGRSNESSAAARVFTGLAFDACAAPPLATMRAWRSSTYRAVGIYVGGRARACAQPNLNPAWVREADRLGWRLLPLYVGSQARCTTNASKKKYAMSATDPRAHGTTEGRDAVRAASSLGIAPGSPIYLDLEAFRPKDNGCAAQVVSFTQGWSKQVRSQGYLAGFYSSADSGVRRIAEARKNGQRDLPDAVWFARWNGTPNLASDPALPAGYWSPHRRIHQYRTNSTEQYGGQKLNIDRNQVDAPVAILQDDDRADRDDYGDITGVDDSPRRHPREREDSDDEWWPFW